MFNYKPLAKEMKDKGKSTEDIAELLNMPLEEVKDKLNHNRFITMSQLHKLCEYFGCGPEGIMSWSPDGDLVKVDWDKVAAFGKPLTVLSVECGMSRSSLPNTRKNGGKVKMDNARKLAEVLGCSVDDLI